MEAKVETKEKQEVTKTKLQEQIKTSMAEITKLQEQINQNVGIIHYCQHLLKEFTIKEK